MRTYIFLSLTLIPLTTYADRECVILLHGLARTSLSMAKLASFLSHENYIVINQSYPSTQKSIEALAAQNIPTMVDKCLSNQVTSIHFVTHSMGGIVLRQYLATHRLPQLGRIVMLAPPNHGSVMADALHDYKLFRLILGPAALELTTANNSVPNTLNGLVNYPVGIIAGSYSFNPLIWQLTQEVNDGIVPVSSTKISNMKDFEILPVSHTFMMSNKQVMNEVAYFLKFGKFMHRGS